MNHLEGVVICISGDPRSDKDQNPTIREQFTDENVRNWLRYRGGQLVEDVNAATTHLICSRAAFLNKKNPKVKSARKHGCYIVTYEWLTDTLQLWDYKKKDAPPRKAPPNLYHPGKPRDGDAISDLFFTKEKRKRNALKQEPLAAADPATVDGDDDAGAAEPTLETGMALLKVSESKTSGVSEPGNEDSCKVVVDKVGASTPANKESNKDTGKLQMATGQTAKPGTKLQEVSGERSVQSVSESGKKEGKNGVDDKKKARMLPRNESSKVDGSDEPPVNLDLYIVPKGKAGLYSIEVSTFDKIGSSRGWRLTLELFESKSEPKTYLFGARKFNTQDSRSCERYFPSKAPGDKKCELTELRKFFQEFTGVDWHQRDRVPSTGPYYYQSSLLPGKVVDSVDRKEKPDQLGGFKQHKPTGSDVKSREPCDRNKLWKRKRSLSEEPRHTAKVSKTSKVSKTVVDVDSVKAKHGGCMTA
ncbi:anthranilate synthase / indole-3-glycerol phosphate synthase [Diaporthe australafricana]|uniref:Anthranilate synthase / indole-3-glycerol phosphate synthase n=1 Tax=Diaporthe australafricana TaxID=127596 RepID=A0ABR3XE96_9PEZI